MRSERRRSLGNRSWQRIASDACAAYRNGDGGLDLSRTVYEAVAKRTGIPVFRGNIADLPIGKIFDVIVMNPVLEHVCSSKKLLEDIRARLRKGGLLHLAAPNILCWGSSFPG